MLGQTSRLIYLHQNKEHVIKTQVRKLLTFKFNCEITLNHKYLNYLILSLATGLTNLNVLSLITLELLLFVKSQFTKNAPKYPPLESVNAWPVTLFQMSAGSLECSDRHKNFVVEVSPLS
jgi:hypothetical protein